MSKRCLCCMAMVVVVLAGCAGRPVKWVHTGYTPQLWAKDSYECERDSQQPGLVLGHTLPGGQAIGIPTGPVLDERMFASCLEARGWLLVDASSPTALPPLSPVPPPSCQGPRDRWDGRACVTRAD